MSVPLRKLEVPEIPGYHLHWVKEANLGRALAAYYEFVEDHEVPINQRCPGTDTEISGNTDLGSRISIAAGQGADGKPERLLFDETRPRVLGRGSSQDRRPQCPDLGFYIPR